jgi:hypothetical protein
MNRLFETAFCGVATALAVGAATTQSLAQTPVSVLNGDFGTPEGGVPLGAPATTLAVCSMPPGAFGQSAAKYWTTYGNTASTSINSWLQPAPTYPAGGPTAPSNLVAVGGGQDGLVQVLFDTHTGVPTPVGQCTATNVNHVSAWVYVIAGQAELQLGNGGFGGGTVAVSSSQWTWERLDACARPDMWNTEIIVYGVGPAVFYVDDVEADSTPNCLSCAHPRRTTGAPLSPECGACETQVCEVGDAAHPGGDPYCCSTAWDDICVTEAAAWCVDECPHS